MNASPMSDDLSALAWVYEEVKKSLEAAQKSLQRCLKESVTTGFSDVDAVDPAVLRNARQQLHQGVGALELAGLSGGATLLRASEALVQRYVNRPQSVSEEGVKAIEAASFALLDFMRRRLAGKPVSVMALFPPYESLTELAGGDMVRPSDLWVQEWPAVSLEVPLAAPSEAKAREAAVDAVDEFETWLLKLLRSGQAADAKPLVGLCADLSAGATARQAHRESATWVLACGFLQAIAEERLPITVHVKRVLSGLLSQLRTLARGQALLSDRLTHELLFFCAQAQAAAPSLPADAAVPVQGSVLDDLRQAFKLTTHTPVDLRKTSLGRFDPSWVTQAIKRVAQAKDGWSAVSANELLRLGGLNEQFSLVADSVRRLYPDGEALAQALQDTVAAAVQSTQAPEPALAMEVATSLLYLDASLDEGEFDHPDERQRVQRLAERMLRVRGGHAPEPLEPWMEALYRKVSDRQTMGSVVQELRHSLGECEKSIDQFFRDPTQTGSLMAVASNLQSMKGVMGVLGLDAASQAVSRMRQDVEALQAPDADLAAAAEAGVHDRLASNLSAVGFLVDMLGVQPSLVKSLFAFNGDTGVLAPIMGRVTHVVEPDVDPVEVIARPAEEQERQRAQDVAETLVDNLSRDDVPVLSLSEELQSLADSPLVLEQPELAASVATAQEALGRASESHDDASLQQAREDMSAALSDFVQSVSQPMALDALSEPLPGPSTFAPLVPEAPRTHAETGLEEDDEMRGIFIEEAREVIGEARTGLADLHSQPDDVSALTAIRRAFHSLKGSSRMVGLGDFGEAGWACEQLFNHCLASHAPASDDLLGLTREVLDHLADWVEDIAQHRDAGRSPQPVVQAADALRLAGRRQPVSSFEIHAQPEPVVETSAHARTAFEETPLSDIASGLGLSPEFQAPNALAEPSEVASEALVDFPELAHADFSDTQADESDESDEPEVAELSLDELPDLVLIDEHELESNQTSEDWLAPDAISNVDLDLLSLDLKDLDGLAASPEVVQVARVTEPQALLEVDEPDAASDEQVKVIGDLRISIPLFNIFLNEADEQSRRLSTMLSEWAMEWHRPVGDDVVALAHSLAGNSGAVGYKGLSSLSRHLEHALMKSQALGHGDTAAAELFNEAAEEIRRLLHQFAAGFLKSPSEELVSRLGHFDADALTRVDAQIVADDAAGRAHLRLVHSSEVQPGVGAAPLVDGEAAAALSMPDVDLSSGFADLPAPVLLEPVHAGAQDTQAQPEPSPLAATPQWPADDTADVNTQPVPLGLPELKPFEPLAVDPLLSLRTVADHGAGVDLGEDGDIEVLDAIDADLFPIFEEEAQELLPQLAADMRQWAEHPDRMDLATACMRTLHTFKGGARLAGAMRLGELAHRMESVVERIVVREVVTPQELESLQARTDILGDVFEALQHVDLTQAHVAEPQHVAPAIDAALTGADALLDTRAGDLLDEAQAPLVQAASDDLAVLSEAQAAEAATEHVSARPIDWRSLGREFRPSTTLVTLEQQGGAMAMVRVRPRLLDRLVNHAGEVSITRTRLVSQLQQMRNSVGDLTENLERLRQQLRDIELQAETQLSTRMEAARAQQQQFDPLEFDRYTRFQELTRMMAESVNDVGTVQRGLVRNLETAEDQLAAQSRLTRDLQDDLLRTRMVEFEGLSDRLYRVVRQAAKETGKQARLDIVGGQTEVDRGVLDRMTGAFEHLLRNCVTHGIELPADRESASKAAMGAIVIAVRQDGNEVSIEFRDDGAGLKLDRIRSKAQALGLINEEAQPTEAELSQMIFQPGFSTAETVTELAGRGIGMDVVRSDVYAMGGRIETATAAGQGTSFKLVLPLTTAVTKVVMVRCGELVASIPTNLIEIVRRTKAEEVEQAYASGQVGYADLTLPFFWFGALLQHSPRGVSEGRSLPVVIVRSAQQRVALHVDEVLGNQDVVVKNLGPQLSRVPGLAGMTLLASGAISLIYNPVALATVYGAQAQAWAQQARLTPNDGAQAPAGTAQPAPMAMPLVLVVDDSLTVRRVTQRLLTREGYRVTLAKDGLEALEKMAEETPAVVLSDIEMPKMDGFDLVRNLRGDARWRSIPVVMITSRIAQKHRDYAAELGVDHYLGKPYSEDELLSLVASYTRSPDITV